MSPMPAVFLALAIAVGALAPLPAWPAFLPHAPIYIDGDVMLQLLGPADGVAGGTGTPEDPYRISGWWFPPFGASVWGANLECLPTGLSIAPSITIRNTQSHILLEQLRIDGTPRMHLGELPTGCSLAAYYSLYGIRLVNVKNVRADRVYVANQWEALWVEQSESVSFSHLNISGVWGATLVDSKKTTIDSSEFHDSFGAAVWTSNSDLVVRSSIFHDNARSLCMSEFVGDPHPLLDVRYNWWQKGANYEICRTEAGDPSLLIEPTLSAPPADAGFEAALLPTT